jgi:hypothetical protein
MPRTRLIPAVVLFLSLSSASADHQAKPLQEPVPQAVAADVRSQMEPTGWQIIDNDAPLLKVWLRREIPGQSKPGEAKGNILFPFLSEGELLGIVEVLTEIGDYRDQPIAPGVYTFRYGLQPLNGDHLGTSPFRDYGCLIPAGSDAKPAALAKKALEKQSAEAAGTSHPAIMMILATEKDAIAGSIVKDEPNERSSVVLPLKVNAGGDSSAVLIQWIFAGHAPV